MTGPKPLRNGPLNLSMSDYLFAYGTLQPGHAPAKIAPAAANLRLVGKGSVRGVLYDIGGYPGAVPNPRATTKIIGTVLELPGDPAVLRRLDSYEGYDPKSPATSEYIRERQTVELSDGRTLACWFYRYNWKPDPARAIASGEWRR